MMTGIFCISADSFYAKGHDDPLAWTGTLDKKLFRVLSHGNDGINIVGRHTYNMMPMLPGRSLFCVSRRKNFGETLEYYIDKYEHVNLLGGQFLVKDSIKKGYLDILFLNIIQNVVLENGLAFTLFEEGIIDKERHIVDEVQFEHVKVEVYKFKE